MQDPFPAHIRLDDKGNLLVQSVSDHLMNTAQKASSLAMETGLSTTLKLAGLLHDMGKYSDDFKDYITRAFRKENVIRGSVNHTFAGVQYLLEKYHAKVTTPNVLPCEIIAYACGAHHGLFDCVKNDGSNEFERRRSDDTIPMKNCIERFNQYCATDEYIELLYTQSCEEINRLLIAIKSISKDKSTCYFLTGMLTRLISSFLIEGDRRDTASFMNDTVFPEPICVEKWVALSEKVDFKINKLNKNAPKNGINFCRETISRTCKEAASLPSGIFRLNVPTGAGKTLSSLRYALNHAARYGKERIIFVTPLLSILEQNAEVIRNTIEDDEIILEHHSNLVMENETEDLGKSHELLVETWDSPIVITTLVQLLNTMFSDKTSSIRRYRSLCNSVIVIDEVQTVPRKMISLFNLAISFLAKCCHTTLVLCSATQPLLEEAHRPILMNIINMVTWEQELWKPFHRTDIVDEHNMTLEEISVFSEGLLKETNSVLVICNRKDEAAYLFRHANKQGIPCCHLSASMCPEHRREVLHDIKKRLAARQQVICYSTQVIEAGVDISFGTVVRLCAGMDSVIQAAGRCNRNGESIIPAKVHVILCIDEKLQKLDDIRDGRNATQSLLSAFSLDSEKYQNDLASDQSIGYYYKRLYRDMEDGAQDYPTKDGITLYDYLSLNQERVMMEKKPNQYCMKQAFKTAGMLFEIFDASTATVLVPWKEGGEIIRQLQVETHEHNEIQRLLKKAKSYSVSVYEHQMEKLKEGGFVFTLMDDSVQYVLPSCYDDFIGLTVPEAELLEV